MRRAKLSAAALARLEHDVRNTYLTFRALGKKYGLSGQRVQQISQRWKIDAHARWVNRREARHREREHQFEIGHYPAPTQGFVRRAARAGLTLQPLVSYGSDGYVSHVPTTALKVNGQGVPSALVDGAGLQILPRLRRDDFLLHFSC
jgi:hypothetical protein